MFISAGGIIAIVMGVLMSAFPPQGNVQPTSAVQYAVERGIEAVQVSPTAQSSEMPEFSLGGQVDNLNGLVQTARGSDLAAQTTDSGWLPDEIKDYAAEHPEYANLSGDALHPTWAATMMAAGEQYVFAGVWYRCGGLGEAQTYQPTYANDPAGMIWGQISPEARTTIFFTCTGRLYAN